ncbi:unnamed protein product, partial [Rotaria magnacalcarata]
GVVSIFKLIGTSITGGSTVTGGGTVVSLFNSTGISAISGTIGSVFNLGGDSNNDSRRDSASSNEGFNLGKPSNGS